MANSQSADIRALLGGAADEDRVAATHLLVGAGFLALGGLLEVLALFALRFGSLSPVSYGRLEPMANLALMIGFLVITLVGGIYYVLPRLTGARLRSPSLARLGLLALVVLVAAGIVVIAIGLGDGSQPLGLPWWLDLPLALVLFAIDVLGPGVLVAVLGDGVVDQRIEHRGFEGIEFQQIVEPFVDSVEKASECVDRIAQLLLCPDERSRTILEAEGVPGRIEVVGDVMADACFRLAPLARVPGISRALAERIFAELH